MVDRDGDLCWLLISLFKRIVSDMQRPIREPGSSAGTPDEIRR